MTRRCCRCHVVLGEKCPACGDPATPSVAGLDVFICTNRACLIISFHAGAGGFTDGYCDPCLAEARASLRRDAGLAPAGARP